MTASPVARARELLEAATPLPRVVNFSVSDLDHEERQGIMSATIEAVTHRWVADENPTLGGAYRVRKEAARMNGVSVDSDDFFLVMALRVRNGVVDWPYESMCRKLYGTAEPPSLERANGYLVLLMDQWHDSAPRDTDALREQQAVNFADYRGTRCRIMAGGLS